VLAEVGEAAGFHCLLLVREVRDHVIEQLRERSVDVGQVQRFHQGEKMAVLGVHLRDADLEAVAPLHDEQVPLGRRGEGGPVRCVHVLLL
jgi:hypothetical protein